MLDKLESSCCEHVRLHRTLFEGDRVTMIHVEKLSIPGNSHLQLHPGGLHIMLIKASPVFQIGDEIPINFQFFDGQQQTVYFSVKAGNDENNK